jgi:hypothetical protein
MVKIWWAKGDGEAKLFEEDAADGGVVWQGEVGLVGVREDGFIQTVQGFAQVLDEEVGGGGCFKLICFYAIAIATWFYRLLKAQRHWFQSQKCNAFIFWQENNT